MKGKMYDIVYFEGQHEPRIETVDKTTMVGIVYDLESFNRTDVCMVTEHGGKERTVWTEEEGLMVPDSYLD